MIKLKYNELREFLDARISNPYQQKNLRSIALGIAVARQVPLPSTALEQSQVNGYYVGAVSNIVSSAVSDFNEQLVVDFDTAVDTARAMWFIRYRAAHPAKYIPLLPGDADILVKLLEAGVVFSKDLHDFCNANATLLITTVNRITQALYPDAVAA